MFRFILLPFASIFLLQSCVPTYIDKVSVRSFTNAASNNNAIHIKTLQIRSYGNISTKVVADNLHNALKKEMMKRGSTVDFSFRSAYGENKNYFGSNISLRNFDGYMLFSPTDTATIDFNKPKFVTGAPVSGYHATAVAYGNAYEETFKIELLDSNGNAIYNGEIRFHFDPTRDYVYDKLAKKLILQLKEANIYLW